MDWSESFMKPEIIQGYWWEIDGDQGTTFYPAEYFSIGEAKADYPGKIYETKYRKGWGARLSAPGYLDCTEWTVHDTEIEAKTYLEEMYDDE